MVYLLNNLPSLINVFSNCDSWPNYIQEYVEGCIITIFIFISLNLKYEYCPSGDRVDCAIN